MSLRLGARLLLAALAFGALAACSSSSTPPPLTCTLSSATVVSIAPSVLNGAGKEGLTEAGDPHCQVIVMEERHDSRAVQVEMAMMLNRLYRVAGLRDLALEGAVVERGAPTAAWFQKLPDQAARAEQALYLLKQGEIGAAEFMAVIHPDFRLHPVEVASQYSVDLSPAASEALTTYFDVLSNTPMTDDQAQRLLKLFHAAVPPDGSATPVEAMPAIIDGVVQLALELKVDVGDAARAIQEERTFDVTAVQRSSTMGDKTFPILQRASKHLVVMDVGEAHTSSVVNLLNQRSASVAVLSPLSLPLDQRHGDLTTAEFDRKLRGRSIEAAGTLGAMFDGRHKPPPSIDAPWFMTKESIMYASQFLGRDADRMAETAAGGAPPPYKVTRRQLGLGDPGGPSGPIDIDPRQIAVLPGPPPIVVFPVVLKDTHKTIWAAVKPVPSELTVHLGDRDVDLAQALHTGNELELEPTVDEALVKIRDEIRKEPVPDDAKPEPTVSESRIASDVKAFFGSDKDAVTRAARSAG